MILAGILEIIGFDGEKYSKAKVGVVCITTAGRGDGGGGGLRLCDINHSKVLLFLRRPLHKFVCIKYLHWMVQAKATGFVVFIVFCLFVCSSRSSSRLSHMGLQVKP